MRAEPRLVREPAPLHGAVEHVRILEAMRGRAKECQTWLDRVLVRLQRSGRSTAAFDEMLGYRVRAARATAGLPWNDGSSVRTDRQVAPPAA